MNALERRQLVGLVFWLVLAGLCGCSSVDNTITRLSGKETTDAVPGVVPPAERVAELRTIREEANRAIPEQQQRISAELATSFQEETDPLLRAEIVRAAEGYPTEAAASLLKAAVGDPVADVRSSACEAWGTRGGAEAVAILSGVLTGDVDNDVRLAAAAALGKTGDEAAVEALGHALEDPDPAMQYLAVQSLREVTDQDFGNDVNRWRQYVNGESSRPSSQPVSFAERIRRMF